METILEVKGMSCGHCEKSVKDALGKFAGVENVVVHLDTGKVEVTHDESVVTVAQIQEAIEDQGYDVVK